MGITARTWRVGRFVITGVLVARRATTAVALIDIVPREPELIRGNKWAWAAVSFVQPVGPIAYFVVGRLPAGTGA